MVQVHDEVQVEPCDPARSATQGLAAGSAPAAIIATAYTPCPECPMTSAPLAAIRVKPSSSVGHRVSNRRRVHGAAVTNRKPGWPGLPVMYRIPEGRATIRIAIESREAPKVAAVAAEFTINQSSPAALLARGRVFPRRPSTAALTQASFDGVIRSALRAPRDQAPAA